MKNKILFPVTFLLFFMSTSKAQQEYMAGSSTVSIEPDSTVFSVALSGYGYPAEGRFSIDWISRGDAPGNITAFTALDGKFYAADSDNALWSGVPSAENIVWKKAGTGVDLKAITGMNGKLFAVNKDGALLMGKATSGNVQWEKLAAGVDLNTLTSLDGKLYATNSKNVLMKMAPLQHEKRWTAIGPANNILSMTSNGERLFAIDKGDTLWHIQPHKTTIPWTEIGRKNGITFKIDIKQMAVLNSRLYAVTDDNRIYMGRHSTDGDLSATAFAIRHNKKTIVMVGVDLTGFDASLAEEVKDIVSKEKNIARSGILINASHTHFSPSAQAYRAWPEYLQHPDSLYLNTILKKGLVRAIENAIDSLSPADLYFGRGTTNIGKNRSAEDPENPHDKTLDVLEARGRGGKVTGVLFLAACHAVFNDEGREGFTISPNFAGAARNIIRAKLGTNAIFIQGCAGDINPRSLDHTKTGQELAEDVLTVLNEKMTRITGDISFSFDTINIPIKLTIPAQRDTSGNFIDIAHVKPWRIDTLKQFQLYNASHFEDLFDRRNANWAGLMINMTKKGTLPAKFPEYVQIITIGDWRLVGLSREAVNEYGPAIRNIWPGKNVSVAGYCNDVPSYLPNKWHIVNHYYEGYDSFFWYGQPGVPDVNVFDIVVDGIKSFKH